MREFETGRFQAIFPEDRADAHLNRTPHLIARVYAIHRNTKYYLVQKRAVTRQSNPDKFTDSASGHVGYRDHFQFEHIAGDACRELKEEMGLTALALEFWETYFSEEEQELVYTFLAIVSGDPIPDPDEVWVKKSRFYSGGELVVLLQEQDFIPHVKKEWERLIESELLLKFLYRWEKEWQSGTTAKTGPAVLIGRFQPFHRGHLLLLEEIINHQGKAIIIIGSKQYSRVPENPFTYEERVRMIRESLPEIGISEDIVEIFGIDDKHDAPQWADEICSRLPPNAILYSNSVWIRNLFSARGIQLAEILKFNFEEYNGTAIRAKIYHNEEWQGEVPGGTRTVIEELLQAGALNEFLLNENTQ